MKKWIVALMALSLILSISSGCAPKEGATGPLPSEAQAKVRSALSEKRSNNELETYELYAAARKDMALLEIETIRTTGLFVLGVTCFQGSMSNHGKDRVTELSVEEELLAE